MDVQNSNETWAKPCISCEEAENSHKCFETSWKLEMSIVSCHQQPRYDNNFRTARFSKQSIYIYDNVHNKVSKIPMAFSFGDSSQDYQQPSFGHPLENFLWAPLLTCRGYNFSFSFANGTHFLGYSHSFGVFLHKKTKVRHSSCLHMTSCASDHS